MSTIVSTPTPARDIAGQARIGGPAAIVKRWWVAYITWRIEQAAITHLYSMSDRELKDIGLTRSQIPRAVRGELGDRLSGRYY